MTEKSQCRPEIALPKPKGLNSDFPKINFFDLDFYVPTFDPKVDLYLLKLPTKYFSFDGDLERLKLEFIDLAIQTFSIHFGVIDNEINLDILRTNFKLNSVYLKPRKGSNLQILFSLDLPSFQQLELGRVFDTDFNAPDLKFLEIKPKKLKTSLNVMFEGFKLYRKKYAAFKKLSMKGLYFDLSGRPFDFNKFIGKKPGLKAPVLSIYPDLDAFFEAKSIRLDFDIGNLLFAFDPDMNLKGIKIKSLNAELPDMSFGGPDLDFLLRKPSFSIPTLNNFLFNIKSINFDLKARNPIGWLDFCLKYAFPDIKLKGLDDFKLEFGDIGFIKNLEFNGGLPGFDPIDPDFDLSMAISKAFKKPTIGKFGLELQDINLRNAGLSLDLNPNLSLDFDPKINMGKLGSFKNNLDIPDFLDIEIIIDQILLEFNKVNFSSLDIKILWEKLLGKIKLPGLIELLKGCLAALLKNLSLDFSLKIILCNALKAFPKEDIIRLLNSFPTEIQGEVFGLVKAELDKIPCLGGGYLDLFLQGAASGGVGLDNELEDVFNVLIDIICDFFAGEVGNHKLELEVNAFTELQEQRRFDRNLKLKNKCKVQKPNLNLDLSIDPGELERKKVAFSGADIGIDVGGVGGADLGLEGLDLGLGGLDADLGSLGNLGVDGIDLPGFEAGKFVGFKNPLEGLGLLLKFLNFFPGAPIVSFALSKLDFPELPDFDAKLPKFFSALDLPDLSIGEISLPKLSNPLAKIPTFFDLQKIGMDLSFNLILSIAVKVLLKLIKKALNGKRRGEKKNLDLSFDPDVAFGNGDLALPDLVGGGFGDIGSLNATFKTAGLDLDTDLGLDFVKELSISLTPLELTNLVIGQPDPSAIDIILNLVEFKFPDLKTIFDSPQAVIDFFSGISFSLPMDYKTSLKNLSIELGKGPNFDIPLAIELCNVDANVDTIRNNRKSLLEGRLPDDLIDEIAELDELLDIEDVEDIAKALQGGVDNVMADAMPPMFPEEPGGESIFELEPQPIVDAILNKIEGDIQHMETAFNNDILGDNSNGFWGSINMLMSDTIGNPFTTHKRLAADSKTYVDVLTALTMSIANSTGNTEKLEKLGQGAFPQHVALYLSKSLSEIKSDSAESQRFKINFSEALIDEELVGETNSLKEVPTLSLYFKDLSSGLLNEDSGNGFFDQPQTGSDNKYPLYSSSIELFISEVKLLDGEKKRILSDNYRLRVNEKIKDYDLSPAASPVSAIPFPAGIGAFAAAAAAAEDPEFEIAPFSAGLTVDQYNDLDDIEETKIDLFSFESKTDFSILTGSKFDVFFDNAEDISVNPNITLLSAFLGVSTIEAERFSSNWTTSVKDAVVNQIIENNSSFSFGFEDAPSDDEDEEKRLGGWFGLVSDLLIDDEEREVKSPLSFEPIIESLRNKYGKMQEDKRLGQDPCFRIKYPFKRLLDKPTRATLMATFETFLSAYCKHHIIKNYNFYSVFKLNFDNLSDLTADYILWLLEKNSKDPVVLSKDPLEPNVISEIFWLNMLEFAVEYYFGLIESGEVKDAPPSIVSYVEFLNDKRAEFGTYKFEPQLRRFIKSVECECKIILREVIKIYAEKTYNSMNDFFSSFEDDVIRFKNLNLVDALFADPNIINGGQYSPREFIFEEDYTSGGNFLDVNGLPYSGPVKRLTPMGLSIYFGVEPENTVIDKCDLLTPIDDVLSFNTIGTTPSPTALLTLQVFAFTEEGEKVEVSAEILESPGLVNYGVRIVSSDGTQIIDFVDFDLVSPKFIQTKEGFDELIAKFIKSPQYNLFFNYCLMSSKVLSFMMVYMDNNLYPSIGQVCSNDAGICLRSEISITTSGLVITPNQDDLKNDYELYRVDTPGWKNIQDRYNKSDGFTTLIWDDWERQELILTTRRFRIKMENLLNLLEKLPGSKVTTASKAQIRKAKSKLFKKKKKKKKR